MCAVCSVTVGATELESSLQTRVSVTEHLSTVVAEVKDLQTETIELKIQEAASIKHSAELKVAAQNVGGPEKMKELQALYHMREELEDLIDRNAQAEVKIRSKLKHEILDAGYIYIYPHIHIPIHNPLII